MSEPLMPQMQLWGPERDKALQALHDQVSAWGLTMPQSEPLVLHFGLNDFWKTGEIEYWIANEEEAGYCGKFLFVLDGQTCPFHRHDVKHETFFVTRGRIRMALDDEQRTMSKGDVLAMPPGTGHSFTGLGNALLLEVSMPSVTNDNFFSDRRIGRDGVI